VQPDWYAFQVCVRDQRKRLDKPATETGESAFAPSPLQNPEIDWEFVQTAIAEMTERLDAMGPVNLEAIQEYDELEERQKFLEDQHADLVKSKNELLDVINKINSTTKELFADTFEQVRKNFQDMFAELFGGGKANLLLVDDTDPLESGIEIIARPPGKQLQSISLLSGGERTMTAVSLLFAIYMVKPSPFCVLDEMDAPLDESNIRRFTKILDRFVHQSQFVVITHNKRTIAKADVLYGVTMEEHGISKLVGVKLTQRENSTESTDLIGTTQASPSIAESFGKHGNLHSETEP
jgi:chromosome segregation protein